MKTSFFFVVWIGIYPLLSLINNPGLQEYSFMVALIVVFGLSIALNKLMFKTILYENACKVVSIMENIYDDKVSAFKRRIDRESTIEAVSAAYFVITTILLLYMMFTTGNNEIFALIIFAFLSIGAFTRAGKLIKGAASLRNNSTPECCMEVAYNVYNIDYEQYYNSRHGRDLKDVLPPRPQHYTLFLIISTVLASLCALLGLAFVVMAVIGLVNGGFGLLGNAIILILYGTLATYFGVKDLIECISSLRNRNIIS